MPISFSSTGVGATASGVTTATWQHVIAPSATALVVAALADSWPPPSIAAKVGTKTMASLGTRVSNGLRVEIFGILSPPTGAQSVTITSSSSANIRANSLAYAGVASFGATATSFFPGISYTMTQTTAAGNWLVAAMGSGINVGLFSTAASGVSRDVRGGYPSLAILDAASTGGATTLTQSAGANADGIGALVTLVPVDTSTALAHTAFSSLSLTATPSATADATSVRMAVAPLSLAATPMASASTVGNRLAASTAIVTATPTASIRHSARFAASLALTAARPTTPQPSLWIFNSSTAVTVGRTSTATVTPAPVPPPAAHSPLLYVGRYPDTEGSISPRSYAEAANDRTKVTPDFINQAVDAQVHPLATVAYVNQQDATRASKSGATSADNDYIPLSGHGLATLNWVNKIEDDQINTSSIVTNRIAAVYSASGSGGIVTLTEARTQLLASVNITDPGWPYTLLTFGWVTGSDPNGTAPNRWSGTRNAGKVYILPTSAASNSIFGVGICASSKGLAGSGASAPSKYSVVPHPYGNQYLTGAMTVGMYGSMLEAGIGRSYTFGAASLFVMVLPAK